MPEKKLFLLDALALIYRAYYALIRSPRYTSKGKNTNAQFGFTNTLLDLIAKEKPTHLAVVFDTAAPTERHTDFEQYKANRQETPEDLIASIPDIKKIIEGFNLPSLELDGYEADDIIGTLAIEAAELGYTVYMVTPDKDYGQIVRQNVYMYKPPFMGNKEEILGEKEICEKWGIKRVDQVIDMLGLMGDTADNIPGIPGIGEKTAAKLLAEYDTLDNVLANGKNIKGAVGEKVRNGHDLAMMSKKLATIITNVPIQFHEENFRIKQINKEPLQEIFDLLEFRTLSKKIFGAQGGKEEQAIASKDLFGNTIPAPVNNKNKEEVAAEIFSSDLFSGMNNAGGAVQESGIKTISDVPHHYYLIKEQQEIIELVQKLSGFKEIAFDTETTNIDANLADLVGMSFCITKGEAYYIPLPPDRQKVIEVLNNFNALFLDETILWVGQNIKYDMIMLKWYGFELMGKIYDTMLAHYVIEPEGKRGMDVLSENYLKYRPVSIETLIGKKGKGQTSMRDVPLEQVKEYAAEDADVTMQLKQVFDPILITENVSNIAQDIENPLVPVLVEMEFEGVGLDVGFLRDYSNDLERDIRLVEDSIYKHAGAKFNIASPMQLGRMLFEVMKIDEGMKKTKTGQFATGEEILQKLRHKHQIVDEILSFRELSKLKSTYVDALPDLINPRTGRLHTSFNQAVAVTGRLSSNNPNLQNIPVRTDRGREIRKAFIPRNDNHLLLSADYSQIELRIIAAISGDDAMIKAFKENKDIHTATAAKVYGIEEKDVTPTMRRAAKAVNFGIIYGQSAFGLAENLGTSRTEAKGIIDNYFTQYPSIKKYMDESIKSAKKLGYAQTILGRKRKLNDINSANHTVRGFAERNAINMPVQGTAADMIKLAMIKIAKEMAQLKMQSKMILQVHDELVFDAPGDEIPALENLVKQNMENALLLPHGLPVKVETGVGHNWLEAH